MEEVIDFVKQAFDGVERFRTRGGAGGIHAEVKSWRRDVDDWRRWNVERPSAARGHVDLCGRRG